MDQKTLEDLVRKYPSAVLSTDEKGYTVISTVVQLQFVHVETPWAGKNPPPGAPAYYQLSGILPPNADVTPFNQAAMKCWQDSPFSKARTGAKHKPLKDQSELNGKYEGFGASGYYFDAKTKNPVDIFGTETGPDGKLIRVPVDQVRAGNYARIKVRAYAYDKNGNWGVGFGLQSIQLIDTSVTFATGGSRDDGFEAINAPKGAGPAQMPAQNNGASAIW